MPATSWRAVALVTCAVAVAGCGDAAAPSADERATTAASTALTAPAPEPPRSFTLVAGGDVLIHLPLAEQARADAGGTGYDFGPLFAGIEPVVSAADLALCHLETPLAPADAPPSGYPLFSAPPQLADSLAAIGYDGCSTASNHTLDQGPDGVAHTLDVLDRAGLHHTGSARSVEEAGTPLLYDVNGISVGHLSYTYGFNGLVPDQPWRANRIDEAAILAAATGLRAAGAQVVLVSLHWGQEYQHEPTAEQARLAKALLADTSIDLVIGHHAHVVQPFELVNGEWVAYGLGNQVARHDTPRGVSEEGVLARFTFTEDPDTGQFHVSLAEYLPTLVDLGPPIRLVNVTAALADPNLPQDKRARYTTALQRTDAIVTSLGAGDAGLRRPG